MASILPRTGFSGADDLEQRQIMIQTKAIVQYALHLCIRKSLNLAALHEKRICDLWEYMGGVVGMLAEEGHSFLDLLSERLCTPEGIRLLPEDDQVTQFNIEVFSTVHIPIAEEIIEEDDGGAPMAVDMMFGSALEPIPPGIRLEPGERRRVFDSDWDSVSSSGSESEDDEIDFATRRTARKMRQFNNLIALAMCMPSSTGTTAAQYIMAGLPAIKERLRSYNNESIVIPSYSSVWRNLLLNLAIKLQAAADLQFDSQEDLQSAIDEVDLLK